MNESRLQSVSKQYEKVYVNEYDDYILIDPGDHTFLGRFADFIHWLEGKQVELDKISADMKAKYSGREMFKEDEEGNIDIDTEQLADLINIQTSAYKECREKVEELFGQDALKKYFRLSYEINPNFIPDLDYIFDFIEEITPVLEKTYGARAERINKKYSKNRRGRHTKTKSELIAEGKARAAGKNE